MRLKKATVKIAAIVLMIAVMSIQAFALPVQVDTLFTANSGIVTPRWDNIENVFPSLSSSGSKLYSEVYVKASSTSAKIAGTMYLEKYSAGKWARVTSWSISGTGSVSLSKAYTGTAGVEYRTRIVVTVNSEKAEAISDSCIV